MFLDGERFIGFQLAGPRLGLEEGEEREECPPGMVKAYLPEWPWHECIPEEEALEPGEPTGPLELAPPPPPPPPDVVGPPEPIPLPEELPEPPEEPAEPTEEPPRPPGKARFLKVDEDTGVILDPNTNQPMEEIYAMTPVSTITTVAVGAGILTAILFGTGVLK